VLNTSCEPVEPAGHFRLFVAELGQLGTDLFLIRRARVFQLHHGAALELDRQVQSLGRQEENGGHEGQCRNRVEDQRVAHEGNIFLDAEKFHLES
jgi:hypothetical protein